MNDPLNLLNDLHIDGQQAYLPQDVYNYFSLFYFVPKGSSESGGDKIIIVVDCTPREFKEMCNSLNSSSDGAPLITTLDALTLK